MKRIMLFIFTISLLVGCVPQKTYQYSVVLEEGSNKKILQKYNGKGIEEIKDDVYIVHLTSKNYEKLINEPSVIKITNIGDCDINIYSENHC